MAGIRGELRLFKSQEKNVRTLLVTNLLFAMVLPIIDVFAGAYVMRSTDSASCVVWYELCLFVGIVFTALVGGLLLRNFRPATIYGFGIILSAVSLMFMMFVGRATPGVICLSGFFVGLSTGFFWTNRYLLTLHSTTDEERNYFFGFESFFFSLWSVVIPIAAGAFLSWIDGVEMFGRMLSGRNGYQIVTIFALIVSICACAALSKGDFKTPVGSGFYHIRFHSLWRKMLLLAALKGMAQGFMITVPAILVMKFVGGEGELGMIQGISGAFTAVLVYVLGRVSKPSDRMKIFGAGLFTFFVGTVLNTIFFSAAGVLAFVTCKVFFQPLHDLAYYPTMMKTIDTVSRIEKRDGYTYIMSHEVGLFAGRAFGMALFIAVAAVSSDDFALRCVLPAVGAIQLLSLPLARNIDKSS
ncbi:MAG: MFS transporter [Bacteroidales bacterium]|nr:MFS transporter [Bacteroidales bacterium]